MEEICDKCGDEMDSRTSMPNPAMGNGSLCSECYLTAEEDLAHQKGMAWIRQQLPSMGQFMEIYCRHCQVEVDKARLEGNCHAAASALVGWFRKKNLTAKIKRGHWLGGDVRPGRREYPAQQHSWVEIALPDNSAGFFLDPTQFVFTGADPGISISRKDDYRYDAGSYRLKELCMGTRQMPERNGHPAQPSTLSDEAKQVITVLYGKQNWDQWTREEMHTLANTNPERLAGHAREIFAAIKKSGNNALIPIDAQREILGC